MTVRSDGSYLSVLINPANRNQARRKAILETARTGGEIDPKAGHLVRVVEYDVPDREGNGTGELIVLLERRHRTCLRAVKRARHNNYPVKKPGQPASTRHDQPPTIYLHSITPRAA